jgi:hypothetical protein
VGCYTIANATGLALPLALLWYALGLAWVVPFAYATFAQVAIYLTIRQPSRRSGTEEQIGHGHEIARPDSMQCSSRGIC